MIFLRTSPDSPPNTRELTKSLARQHGCLRDTEGTLIAPKGTEEPGNATPGLCTHCRANPPGVVSGASLWGCALAASARGSSPGASGAHLAASRRLTHPAQPPRPALLGTCVICAEEPKQPLAPVPPPASPRGAVPAVRPCRCSGADKINLAQEETRWQVTGSDLACQPVPCAQYSTPCGTALGEPWGMMSWRSLPPL